MQEIYYRVVEFFMDNLPILLFFIALIPVFFVLLLTFLDNCWSYAVRKWKEEGGYLCMRRSRAAEEVGLYKRSLRWWIPHFLHMDKDRKLTHYGPTKEEREYQNSKWWRFWLRLPHFKGEIKHDDD